jgi:hypothetical protein
VLRETTAAAGPAAAAANLLEVLTMVQIQERLLSVAGLIAALERAQAIVGPEAPVRMVDEEPVVSVSVMTGEVYISDRQQQPQYELAELDLD